MPEYSLPAFVSVHEGGRESYRSWSDIEGDPDLRESAMDQAYVEIEEWSQKWLDLFRYCKDKYNDKHTAPGIRLAMRTQEEIMQH